jgi:hypothetical protein
MYVSKSPTSETKIRDCSFAQVSVSCPGVAGENLSKITVLPTKTVRFNKTIRISILRVLGISY